MTSVFTRFIFEACGNNFKMNLNLLSVIIPVYNEEKTIKEIVARVRKDITVAKEIIIVDDGSRDNTRFILEEGKNWWSGEVRIFLQPYNQGKGSAVRRGLEEAKGDYAVIQDADLECDPKDINKMVEALEKSQADLIYGSRNLVKHTHADLLSHLGSWLITKLLNLLYGLKLTDAGTCYKLFPRSVWPDFVAGRFEAELLFTAAVARKGLKIAEVPISYHPRSFKEGKKITYGDGLRAIFVLIADRFFG